jgi:hypothetical protein
VAFLLVLAKEWKKADVRPEPHGAANDLRADERLNVSIGIDRNGDRPSAPLWHDLKHQKLVQPLCHPAPSG